MVMVDLYRLIELAPEGEQIYYGFFESEKKAISALLKEYKNFKSYFIDPNYRSGFGNYKWVIQKLGSMKTGKIECTLPWKTIYIVDLGDYPDDY